MKLQVYKIFLVALVIGLWTLTSCQKDPNDQGTEFAPQMYLSKSYEPYTQTEVNPLNPLGINMRSPAQNTIPRRKFNPEFELEDSLGNTTKIVDVMYYNISRDDAGRELASKTLRNPLPITEKTLAEGKALYNSYCSACHGAAGEGDGKVSQKYKGVANLKGSAYANLTAGHIFHVITNGKGLMWPHGSQLNADERWKVVHFVHQLMGKIPEDLSTLKSKPAKQVEFKAEKGASFVLNNVLFETGSAVLKAESKQELDRLIKFLKDNPQVSGEIDGHTDNAGNAEANKKLSEERAKSVFEYLTKAGITPERLAYKGFGDTQPKGDNKTEEGKATNRRIEFKVLDIKQS